MSLRPSFKFSPGWVIAIIGIFLFVWAYFLKFHELYPIFSDIILNISEVLVIGVLMGYLASVDQWAGIFKKDIQDVVYGKEFLNKRNDIEDIWYNVTKQMFKFKFSDIHKDLLSSLKLALPGEEDISYYEDFDADTKIEWIDKSKGLIKSIDTMSMYIVAETEKEFFYPVRSWTRIEEENEFQHCINITVDREPISNPKSTKYREGQDICIETKIRLKGKKRYFLHYTREKVYNLFEDYYIGYRAKYITKDLHVSLELPPDIEAIFIERGTAKDFVDVKNTKNHIKKSYKGVIFPKQGYIFALRIM